MKTLILLILFISASPFAKEPAFANPKEKNHESAPPPSDTPNLQQDTTNADIILNIIIKSMKQGRWLEKRLRGPVFNTCSTWKGAVQCIWAILRIDNHLTEKQLQSHTHLINSHLTAENLEQEMSYIQAFPDSITPTSKAWFLLLTVEFILWTLKEEKFSDTNKLVPMANIFTSELLAFIKKHSIREFKGLQRGLYPFILYALYNYISLNNTLSKGASAEALQELSALIKAYFFHRNDGGAIDQTAKTRACSIMKRAGIHKDYLEEKGLLLPGYEEFEKRAAQEDIQRIKRCETVHETITFSGDGPGEPKDMASTIYYANVLLLLKKTGGDEAVKYFLRHNPIPHREFDLPEKAFSDNSSNPAGKGIFLLHRIFAASILEEIYDDPEWRMTWQSISSNYKKIFLSISSPTLELAIYYAFSYTEPHSLNHQIIFKK